MQQKLWNHHKIAFGGDYNPEQWDESVWQEDMRLFRLAHIDTVTLNVFSWAALQPSENVYDFSKLDRIMEMAKANGLKVVLATSTAAHPAWMAKKYPEILRTEANGMRRKFGFRHNSCPNSPVFRKFSVRLAEKLAERYQNYDNIIAWHISNEYGGECYCENCEKAFRVWLQKRYHTLDNLNRAWNTAFWSHTYYDWDEIVVPNYLSEQFGEEQTHLQGCSLDYRRFNSESIRDCFRLEYAAVKKFTPNIPVTTNFMEFHKPLDLQDWAKYMDFVAWDSYPRPDTTPARIALNHEMIRSLKHGDPFILMEQTPSVTNWQPYNALKRPGVMALQSYQAVAHGADSVMFFQMRRNVGGFEKFHGAIIDHSCTEHTRVFREITALGAELERLGDRTLGSRTPAQVGVLFDWENWWAVEASSGPTGRIRYLDEVERYFTALYSRNYAADVVGPEGDFGKYKVLVAPMLYMLRSGMDEKLRQFVKAGGTLVVSYFSGYVDESDRVTLGGYPGKLRDILGIWVEETDALPEGLDNHFLWDGKRYPAGLLCDLLHCESAEPLSVYQEDFYAGMPVVTENRFGMGRAYYVAAQSDIAFYKVFLASLCQEQGVFPVLETPRGVEAALRVGEGKAWLFLLNHTQATQEVAADADSVELLSGEAIHAGDRLILPPAGVKILERNWEN